MDKHDRQVVHSRKATGGHDFWQTPETVLALVRQLHPRGYNKIDLDPCGGDGDSVQAIASIKPPQDGLAATWNGSGLVFVNPPYSNIRAWARKAVESRGNHQDQIILLCPARTDTRWWHESAWTASAICFWKSQVKFYDPIEKKTGPAPFPSALLYWGYQMAEFKRVFSGHGYTVVFP